MLFSTSFSNDSTKKFECLELGWTFNYPANWEVLSKSELKTVLDRGTEAIENSLNQEIKDTLKTVLALRKDKMNTFIATIQPYDSILDGNYSENQKLLYQVAIKALQDQNVKFDYKIGKEIIGGLEFKTLAITLYNASRNRALFNQIMYDKLINGKNSLTITIGYNNEVDKSAIYEILRTSKFTHRR